jgi:AcrR family transcriptional regulator
MPQQTTAANRKPVQSKRKRSARAIETERRFLEAANEVFWRDGFAASNIKDIIDTSGQSVGSFYHQFEDKADLLERSSTRVIDDFNSALSNMELSREANGDLFTLFYRLAIEGRSLVERNKGIYRALSEKAQNNLLGYGPLGQMTPTMARKVNAVIGEYGDQLSEPPTEALVKASTQLLATCVMQSGLGMGPLFPQDTEGFAQAIARGACGILAYTGSMEKPLRGDGKHQ